MYDLLLHVDRTDGSLGIALGNAVHYATALEKEAFRMVLVVNSKAVTELTADNAAIAHPLAEAHHLGLGIRVCSNALQAAGINRAALFPQCTVVPSGIVELVRLQEEGYAYVKP